jgi:exo-beta-1,3-glucanase (GH17 family)
MKFLPGLLIAAVFATLTFAVWAALNRPTVPPAWPDRIKGFSFSPFRANEDAIHNELPTDEEIDSDLKLLAGKVDAVRTYGVNGTLADVPQLAERYGINVALGALAWMGGGDEQNDKGLATAIQLARTHVNVVRVFIGNEVVLRGDIPMQKLAG